VRNCLRNVVHPLPILAGDAAALLRESRPMTARHSAPVLTFTHGDLLKDGSATDASGARKPAGS